MQADSDPRCSWFSEEGARCGRRYYDVEISLEIGGGIEGGSPRRARSVKSPTRTRDQRFPARGRYEDRATARGRSRRAMMALSGGLVGVCRSQQAGRRVASGRRGAGDRAQRASGDFADRERANVPLARQRNQELSRARRDLERRQRELNGVRGEKELSGRADLDDRSLRILARRFTRDRRRRGRFSARRAGTARCEVPHGAGAPRPPRLTSARCRTHGPLGWSIFRFLRTHAAPRRRSGARSAASGGRRARGGRTARAPLVAPLVRGGGEGGGLIAASRSSTSAGARATATGRGATRISS